MLLLLLLLLLLLSYQILGVTGSFTQFYHGENNFELLPGPIGSLSSNPVDFTGSYSLGLIVSRPYYNGDKSVLIHLSDSEQVCM